VRIETPKTGSPPLNGFEVRAGHQTESVPLLSNSIIASLFIFRKLEFWHVGAM
jgi:hypothetical protein